MPAVIAIFKSGDADKDNGVLYHRLLEVCITSSIISDLFYRQLSLPCSNRMHLNTLTQHQQIRIPCVPVVIMCRVLGTEVPKML